MYNDPFFSPEVVSVPVHFFSSKQPQKPSSLTNESSALKIQSVFRGFLVRTSVNKISLIRNQVCEVENNINDANFVELMRTDVKERLRVSERLMLLLLKLDSIRGVDYGVRHFRKGVIKKAIALQEVLDSVVDDTVICTDSVMNVVNDDETVEIDCGVVTERSVHVADTDCVMNVNGLIDVAVEEVSVVDSIVNDTVRFDETVEIDCETVTEQVTGADRVLNVGGLINVTVEEVSIVGNDTVKFGETVEIDCETVSEQVTDHTDCERNVDGVIDVTVEDVNVVDSVVDDNAVRSGETVETDCGTVTEQVTDHTDCVMNVDALIDVTVENVKEIDVSCDLVGVLGEGMDDRKRSVELLEKLMDDNEKMTTLMTQMFERDEMQTRMINSLSRRVEQLEKRFKPRKKKKKMHSA